MPKKLSDAQRGSLEALSRNACDYFAIARAGGNGQTIVWLVRNGYANEHDDDGRYWMITDAGRQRLEAP